MGGESRPHAPNRFNDRNSHSGGVLSSTRRLVDVQGSLEQSRSTTDLAVAGDGFCVVSENDLPLTNGGSVAFTRSGSFSVDAPSSAMRATCADTTSAKTPAETFRYARIRLRYFPTRNARAASIPRR